MCNLPGKRAVDEIAREGGVRNSLPALVAKQDELCWQDVDVNGLQPADKPGNPDHLQYEDHVGSAPLVQDTPKFVHDTGSTNGISTDVVPDDVEADSIKGGPCAFRKPTGNATERNPMKLVGLSSQKRMMGKVVRCPQGGPGSDQTSFPETGERGMKLSKDAGGPGFDQTPSPTKGNNKALSVDDDINCIGPEGDPKIDKVVGSAQDRAWF